MSPPQNAPHTNANRTKALAAVLLAVVLFVALGYRTSEPDNILAAAATTAPALNTTPPATLSAATPASVAAATEARPLPPVDLNKILRHNPFRGGRTPTTEGQAGDGAPQAGSSVLQLRSLIGSAVGRFSALARARAASGATSSPESSATSAPKGAPPVAVSAIVTGGARPAALIGDKTYYESDLLDNGWRIVAIRAHGIVVQSAAD